MRRRRLLIGAGGALLLGTAGVYGWRSAVGSMEDYARWTDDLRAPLPSDPGIADLVRYATLAANGHNTQPWQFGIGDGVIEILPDLHRATPVVDPDNHHLYASLGCAAENLAIAAAATGRPGEVQVDPGGSVRFAYAPGAARTDPLFRAIARRQSTRSTYNGWPVPPADLDAMRKAAEMPGVRLVLLTDRPRIDRVRDLVVAGNDMQMRDPAFMAELKRWVRFSPRNAIRRGDGLFAAASGNPVLPEPIGGLAFDRFVTASAENDRYASQMNSSAGVAIFFAEREDRAHWIAVGRACQRLALAATALGLKHAFVNQPVEVPALRPDIAALAGEPGRRPDIVMRFGYGRDLPFSPRRPVREVMA